MEIRQVYETELASVLDLIDEYDRDSYEFSGFSPDKLGYQVRFDA